MNPAQSITFNSEGNSMPDSNETKNKRLPVALFSLLTLATLLVLVIGSAQQTGGATGGETGGVPLVGGNLDDDAVII